MVNEELTELTFVLVSSSLKAGKALRLSGSRLQDDF